MDRMIELFEFLHQFFSEGISWATGVAVILGALKIMEGRRKRLEQKEMNRKLDIMMTHLHIPDYAPIGRSERQCGAGRNGYLWWPRLASFPVRDVGKYTYWRNYWMKLNKAILLPVLAAVATLVKELYNYEIPDQYVDIAATVILWAIGAVGIFLHPKKDVLSDAEKNYLEE